MMNIVEFFNQDHNYNTEFSKNIKDYRILVEKREIKEYFNEDYEEYYTQYRNFEYYVITADREIPFNNLYYWLGDLIVDKDNKIIDGIAFN